MAIYKPNNFYPYMQEVDLEVTEGVIFSCQANTDGHSKIRSARLKIFDKNNEVLLYEKIQNLDRPVSNGELIEFKVEPYLSEISANAKNTIDFVSLKLNEPILKRIQDCPYCLYQKQLKNTNCFRVVKDNILYDFTINRTDSLDNYGHYIYEIDIKDEKLSEENNKETYEYKISLKNGIDYVWTIEVFEHEFPSADDVNITETLVGTSKVTGSCNSVLWFDKKKQTKGSLDDYYNIKDKDYFVDIEFTPENSNFLKEEKDLGYKLNGTIIPSVESTTTTFETESLGYGNLLFIPESTESIKVGKDEGWAWQYQGSTDDYLFFNYKAKHGYFIFGDFYKYDDNGMKKLKTNYMDVPHMKLIGKNKIGKDCEDLHGLGREDYEDFPWQVFDSRLTNRISSTISKTGWRYIDVCPWCDRKEDKQDYERWKIVKGVTVTKDESSTSLLLTLTNAEVSNEEVPIIGKALWDKSSYYTQLKPTKDFVDSDNYVFACPNAETTVIATDKYFDKSGNIIEIDDDFTPLDGEIMGEIGGRQYRFRVLSPAPFDFTNVYKLTNGSLTNSENTKEASDAGGYQINFGSIPWKTSEDFKSGSLDYNCFGNNDNYNAIEDFVGILPKMMGMSYIDSNENLELSNDYGDSFINFETGAYNNDGKIELLGTCKSTLNFPVEKEQAYTITLNKNSEQAYWDVLQINGEKTNYSSLLVDGSYLLEPNVSGLATINWINNTDVTKPNYIKPEYKRTGYTTTATSLRISNPFPDISKIENLYMDIGEYKNEKVKQILEDGTLMLYNENTTTALGTLTTPSYSLKTRQTEKVIVDKELSDGYEFLKFELENPMKYILQDGKEVKIYPHSMNTTKNSFFYKIDDKYDYNSLYVRFPEYNGEDAYGNKLSACPYIQLLSLNSDNKIFPYSIFEKGYGTTDNYRKLFKITSYNTETNEIIIAGGLARIILLTDVFEIWKRTIIEGSSNSFNITEANSTFERIYPSDDGNSTLTMLSVPEIVIDETKDANGNIITIDRLKIINSCESHLFISPWNDLLNNEYNYSYLLTDNNSKLFLDKNIKNKYFDVQNKPFFELDNTQWFIEKVNNLKIGDYLEFYQDGASGSNNYFYGRTEDDLQLFIYEDATREQYEIDKNLTNDMVLIQCLDFHIKGVYKHDEQIKRYRVKLFDSNMNLIYDSEYVYNSTIDYHVRGLNNNAFYYLTIEYENYLNNVVLYEQLLLTQFLEQEQEGVYLNVENREDLSALVVILSDKDGNDLFIDDLIDQGYQYMDEITPTYEGTPQKIEGTDEYETDEYETDLDVINRVVSGKTLNGGETFLVIKTGTPIDDTKSIELKTMYECSINVQTLDDGTEKTIYSWNVKNFDNPLIDIYKKDNNGVMKWVYQIDLINDKMFYDYFENSYRYGFVDYNVSNTERYEYIAVLRTETIDESIQRKYTIAKGSGVTCFNCWSIASILEEDGVYNVLDDVWTFKYNLETDDLTQNTSTTTWDTLGQYGNVSMGVKNYTTSGLRCLLGDVGVYDTYNKNIVKKNGYHEKYIQKDYKDIVINNISKYKKWKSFCNSFSKKILKDLKGNKWIVQIVDNPTVSNDDKSIEQVYTISFKWQEIENSENLIICNKLDTLNEKLDAKTIKTLIDEYGRIDVSPSPQDLFEFVTDTDNMTASISLKDDYKKSEFQNEESVVYTTDNSGIMTIKETEINLKKIVVPYQYKDNEGNIYQIIGISASGFANCKNIQELILPKKIQTIGNQAFYNCSGLTSMSLLNDLETIGESAFEGCNNLNSITMLNNVTTINKNAFKNCTNLQNIVLSDRIEEISEGLFENCSNLSKINIPNGVSKVNNRAFTNCTLLNSLALPEITSLGESAFEECTNLKYCNIPSSLTSIGASAFKNCSALLEDIIVPINVTEINNSTFEGCSKISGIKLHDNITTIGTSAFKGCVRAENEMLIPNKLITLGSYAFADCERMTGNIVIPDLLEEIPESAFEGCASIVDVFIPDTVTTIGANILKGCSKLNSLTIPFVGRTDGENKIIGYLFGESVYSNKQKGFIPGTFKKINITNATSIYPQCFEDCSSLTDIRISNSIVGLGSNAFQHCYNVINLEIPFIGVDRELELNRLWVLFQCDPDELNVQSLIINNGTDKKTDIHYECLAGCTSLKEVYISAGVEKIGASAFKGCSNLTKVTFEQSDTDGITTINDSAFEDCKLLTDITIPSSVTNLGANVFKGCSSLTTMKIPNNVTTIGEGVLSGCQKLTSLTIPFIGETKENVKHFGYLFGADTYNLNENFVPQSVSDVTVTSGNSIADYTFYYCKYIQNISLQNKDNNITSLGQYAFYQCDALSSFNIPDTVNTVGIGCFGECHSLTHIDIPSLITVIPSGFVQNCTKLSAINIPEHITTINDYAFKGCSRFTSITIPDSVTSVGLSILQGCTGLTSVTLPDLYNKTFSQFFGVSSYSSTDTTNIPQKLRTVKITKGTTMINSAFAQWSILTTIDISKCSYSKISSSTFKGCSGLLNITIPNTVTSIGENVFNGCSALKEITLPFVGSSRSVNKQEDAVFGYIFGYHNSASPNTTEQFYDYGYTESKYYYIPSTLKKVTITDATQIPRGAFYNCKNLTNIILNDKISKIETEAFCDCVNLESLIIPDSCLSIGESCLNRCLKLKDLTLPVTDCSSRPNQGIKGMFDIVRSPSYNIPEDIKITVTNSIWQSAFEDLENVKYVEIGENVRFISAYAFRNSGISSIIIPKNVTHIQNSAFQSCKHLEEIIIIDGLTEIWDGAFADCVKLTEIIIPDSVNHISDNAFRGCFCLKNIVLSKNIQSISNYMFAECSSLTSVDIPDGVTAIGEHAFEKCSSLTSVDIPDGVTAIKPYTFSQCSKVTEFIGKGVQVIEDFAFYCNSADYVTIPDNVITISEQAFTSCTNMRSLIIGNQVETIGKLAFSYCSNLISVTFGNNLKTIAEGAFRNCNLLGDIRIPDSVTDVGDNAFADYGYDNDNRNIYIGKGMTYIPSLMLSNTTCKNIYIHKGVICFNGEWYDHTNNNRYPVNIYYEGTAMEWYKIANVNQAFWAGGIEGSEDYGIYIHCESTW